MNRPISLLIKRSKGLSEVVKGKHSAHRLNRCMTGYVQYPDTLTVTGVGISAGAGVFFSFMYTRDSYLCYVLTLDVCLPIEVFRLMIWVDCNVGAQVSCVLSL